MPRFYWKGVGPIWKAMAPMLGHIVPRFNWKCVGLIWKAMAPTLGHVVTTYIWWTHLLYCIYKLMNSSNNWFWILNVRFFVSQTTILYATWRPYKNIIDIYEGLQTYAYIQATEYFSSILSFIWDRRPHTVNYAHIQAT